MGLCAALLGRRVCSHNRRNAGARRLTSIRAGGGIPPLSRWTRTQRLMVDPARRLRIPPQPRFGERKCAVRARALVSRRRGACVYRRRRRQISSLPHRACSRRGRDPILKRIAEGRYRPHKALWSTRRRQSGVRRHGSCWTSSGWRSTPYSPRCGRVMPVLIGACSSFVAAQGQGSPSSRSTWLLRSPRMGMPHSTPLARGRLPRISERLWGDGRRRSSSTSTALRRPRPGEIDVVISDEAHRIREFSWNWRTPQRVSHRHNADPGAASGCSNERLLH